jgi:hypothetical protein
MLMIVRIPLLPFAASLLLPVVLTGCTRISTPSAAETRAIAQQQRQEMEMARQQMEMIPPPSKTRYMAVKSLAEWENPSVTVQGGMVTLHVLLADANTSDLGVGGMLRPVGARRQELNVRVDELPMALHAVPGGCWPYGRVVAIEEAHNTPASARPEVRRNMEIVMKQLDDLGVVVYEWNDSGRG